MSVAFHLPDCGRLCLLQGRAEVRRRVLCCASTCGLEWTEAKGGSCSESKFRPVKSSQVKSNQVKSSQVKSNQIKVQHGETERSDASAHQKQLRHFKRLESYRNRLTLVLRYRCLCTTCLFRRRRRSCPSSKPSIRSAVAFITIVQQPTTRNPCDRRFTTSVHKFCSARAN